MADRTRRGTHADLLQRDLTEARGHLAATSEILAVLGRSGSDLQGILGAVVEAARSLCGSDTALIYLIEKDVYYVAGAAGVSDEVLDYLKDLPFRVDKGSLIGRVAMSRKPGTIVDVLEDPSYGRADVQRVAGFRTVMAAPMFLDEDVVGVINVWRMDVDPFDEGEMTLLAAFATHAAVAIRNAHLVRALEERGRELEEVSRHKSEFLASMSHELRTPLNAIIGFSEVLLERMFGDINERQEEYLNDILGSGRHLLELLNDILDLSKVEAGAMELDRSTFPMSDTVQYGLSLVRERAARRGVELRYVPSDDASEIYADELRVKQVLLNLLSNAVKFTPRGGAVEVRLARTQAEAVVQVADTGPGIAAEDQERIFEAFQQGNRSPTRQEGTGLGLTLCRRIVELHGGTISVESEPGSGSTFEFRLPLAVGAVAARTAGVARKGEELVLLVEDDQSSLDLLDAYLEGSGYQVSVARNGVDGLEAVRRDHPAVVILDIRLPGLVGWDVLAAIKADPATEATPVVVLSVLDERARGLSQGAAAYLVKPARRDQVLAALDDVLGRAPEPASSREAGT